VSSESLMPNNKKPRVAPKSAPPPAARQESEPRKFAPWTKHLAVAAVLFVVTLLAYSNSFHARFTIDNDPIILQDARIHDATWENVSQIFTQSYWVSPEKGLYRPLTTFTYFFNCAILGNANNPEGYHWFNLFLQFVNVMLCYGLALSILRQFWPAVFVAALWAVHPILTESVTNIVGRADLLAGFGVLSGLWMYWISRESTGARRVACLIGLTFASAIGIFSKESGIAILGLIALCEIAWWKDRSHLRNCLYACAAAGLPIAAYLFQRAHVLARSTVPVFLYVDNPLLGASFLTARLTAIKVLARYLWLLVWPAHLSWNYYYAEIPLARGTWQDWISWLVVAAAIAGVYFSYRRNRAVFFFAGLAFVALIPVSNLLILIGSIMADRFLYLPSIGFAACVVIALHALGRRINSRAFAPVILCVMILALGIRTWSRNADWLTNATILAAGVRDTPNSFASHFALGTQMFLADPTHANIDPIIVEAEKSVAILDPLPDELNFADPYANAGTYYQAKGDSLRRIGADGKPAISPESVAAYHRALQILLRGASIAASYDQQIRAKEMARGKADSEIPHYGPKSLYPELAVIFYRLGDYQKALDAIQRALVIDPEQPKTFLTLAQILLTENKTGDAVVALHEAYMISGNGDFLQPVSDLYLRGLDPKGCAISRDANGVASLNTFCEPVHNDICRAKVDLIRVYTQAHRQDLIDDLKSRMAADTPCTGAPVK
jgi:protein O-mannosyl-transferase